NIKQHFALSALLLKSVENAPDRSPVTLIIEEELDTKNAKLLQTINDLIEENNKLKIYKEQTERLTPFLSENFLNYLSILTTGCASEGRLASSQYILETLL